MCIRDRVMAHRPYGSVQNRMYPSALYCTGGLPPGFLCQTKTPEELETELSGVIFRDIDCPETAAEIAAPFLDLNRYPLVTSDEYLSGNVRQKLRMAKALWEVLPAEKKARIKTNTEALETVQPKDLAAGDISVRISVNWIPLEIYQQFMYELLDTSIQSKRYIKILRSEHSSQWNITGKSTDLSLIHL